MATIIEVAKAAGVSQGAASDILRGSFRYKYRAATIESVREAAARLGYQANPAARMLREQTKTMIGMAVPLEEFGKQGLARLVAAAHHAVIKEGFQPIQVESRQLISSEAHVPFPSLDLMAGVLSADSAMEETVPDYYKVIQDRLPVVALYPTRSPEVSYVTVNRPRIVEMAAEHLAGLGHKRIAMVGCWDSQVLTDVQKVEGWSRVIKRYSLDPNPRYRIKIEPQWIRSYPEACQQIAHTIMTMQPRPTALICLSGLIAIGVMNRLAAHGWKLPEQLSVIGYDYEAERYGAISFPPLTALVRPIEAIGELAAKHLVHLIRDAPEENLLKPYRELLDPLLIVRESTAPPPRD